MVKKYKSNINRPYSIYIESGRRLERLKTTYIEVKSARLSCVFDGFKIAQVSDLHNKDFKGRLLSGIAEQHPDIIVITGDMIDKEKATTASLTFAEQATKIAPVYYVNGNHESVLKVYPEFIKKLRSYGVNVLENQTAYLERDGAKLIILGMSDPRFFKGGKPEWREQLQKIAQQLCGDSFLVLISHRPELFGDYVNAKIDVTFAGHAHGGQVRLPFLGAIFAPNQGFFPRFTKGVYASGDSQMVLSCGLGRSNFVPRIFNPPELVIATLKSARAKND